jgi:RNA polymerase sigma-70 factor (ECF subfamily)
MANDIDELYGRHSPGIRRYLARLVGSAEAEDLTQDVFEKAHRALHTHRAEARLSTWLYRIATYAAIDRLRSRSVRERDDVSELAYASEIERRDDDRPDHEVLRSETRGCILRLVETLPPSGRAVVLLSGLREMSDRDTAEALGITVGAAKIRLHRARRQLRKLMECECRLYRDERNELGCEPKAGVASAGALHVDR